MMRMLKSWRKKRKSGALEEIYLHERPTAELKIQAPY